jgi:Cysteinyl-tRNA synthetase
MIPLHFKIVSPSNLLHCPLYRKGQSLLYKHNCNGHNQKHPQHAVSFSSLVSCRTTTATTATTTRRRRRRDITAADAAAAIDAVTNIPCKNMAVASFKDSRRFLCNKKKNILAVSSLSLGKNSSRSSHCCFRKRESFLMTPFPPLPPRRRCDSSRHDGLGSGSGSIRTKTTTSTATTVPTKKANATTTTNSDNTDATHGKINERSSSSSSSRSHNSNNHNHHGGLYLYDSLSQTSKVIPVSIPRHHQDSDKQNSATDRSRKGIAWYTCGPTVYDSAHLGHARTYVSLDILQRCLRQIHKMQYLASSTHSWLGPSTVASSAPASPTPAPIFIMNITNVDDKILARSKERNIPAFGIGRILRKRILERYGCIKCHETMYCYKSDGSCGMFHYTLYTKNYGSGDGV